LNFGPEPGLNFEPEPGLNFEPEPELDFEPEPELDFEPELELDFGPEPGPGLSLALFQVRDPVLSQGPVPGLFPELFPEPSRVPEPDFQPVFVLPRVLAGRLVFERVLLRSGKPSRRRVRCKVQS
jgi:hypothetical protein